MLGYLCVSICIRVCICVCFVGVRVNGREEERYK